MAEVLHFPAAGPACPHCGAVDAFRRAEAIHAGGVSSFSGHSSGLAMGGISMGESFGVAVLPNSSTMHATLVSEIAKTLAPPPRPHVPGDPSVASVILTAVVYGVLLFGASDTIAFVALLVGTAIVLGPVLLWTIRQRARRGIERQRMEEQWRRDYDRWTHLWYCGRCGQTAHVD